MICAAREGQNEILKAGLSMSIEYFIVSQDVKSSEESLSYPWVTRTAEQRVLCCSSFREILLSRYIITLASIYSSFMGRWLGVR